MGLQGMSCDNQLRTLCLSGLEERKLKIDLIALYSFLKRGQRDRGAELFFLGQIMVQSYTRWDLDWTFGTIYLLKGSSNSRTDFLREVFDAPNLSVFKRHLENML